MPVFRKINQKKVFYLNSTKATIVSNGTGNSGANYLDYSWNIPELCLNDYGEVQIGSISSIGASTTAIYTVRLKNVSCKDVWDSAFGAPILASLVWNNSVFKDEFGVALSPQNINNITLSINDSISNRDNGITNTIQFVICLVIIEYEPEITEYGERVGINASQRPLTSTPMI